MIPQARFRYGSQRNGTKLEGERTAMTSLSAGVLAVHCGHHSIPTRCLLNYHRAMLENAAILHNEHPPHP